MVLTPVTLLRGTRWIWTLLILGLMAVQWYLAFWQWERYQLRLDEGALLSRQLNQKPLTIPLTGNMLEVANTADWIFRQATVEGVYDFEHQFLWVGPRDRMEPGPHLVTPVRLTGDQAILVDRGWISAVHETPEDWRRFDDQTESKVAGILLPAAEVPDPEFLAQQTRPVLFWSKMDLAAIQEQLPYELLPVYLHQEPEEGVLDETEPRRTWYTLRTPPSMHLSYAVQWIMSSLILGFLYVMIIRFIERRALYRATGAGNGASGDRPLGNRQKSQELPEDHG